MAATFRTTHDAAILIVILYLLNKVIRKAFRSEIGVPPGPPGAFLVGNTYQIPSNRQWLKFDHWIREYGRSQVGFSLRHPRIS